MPGSAPPRPRHARPRRLPRRPGTPRPPPLSQARPSLAFHQDGTLRPSPGPRAGASARRPGPPRTPGLRGWLRRGVGREDSAPGPGGDRRVLRPGCAKRGSAGHRAKRRTAGPGGVPPAPALGIPPGWLRLRSARLSHIHLPPPAAPARWGAPGTTPPPPEGTEGTPSPPTTPLIVPAVSGTAPRCPGTDRRSCGHGPAGDKYRHRRGDAALLPPPRRVFAPPGETGAGSHGGRPARAALGHRRPAGPEFGPGGTSPPPGLGAQNVPETFAHRLRRASESGSGPGHVSPAEDERPRAAGPDSPLHGPAPPRARAKLPGGRSPGEAGTPPLLHKSGAADPGRQHRRRERPDRPTRAAAVRGQLPWSGPVPSPAGQPRLLWCGAVRSGARCLSRGAA